MTTPKQRYGSDLKREGFVEDKAQKLAVDHLDTLYFRLVAAYNHKRDTSFASKMKRIIKRKKIIRYSDFIYGAVWVAVKPT